MKLRYYMRGLGIGILVTALLLVLSGRKENSLSDQQIIERATELGMVMDDKSVLKESKTEAKQEETTPETETEQKETTPEPVEQEEQGKVQKVEEPVTEEPKQEKITPEPVKQEEQGKIEKVEEPATEETKQEETVTITVASGASSVSVAKQIEQAGLVDSAADFDSYLCRNGYDKKIRVGNHVIPKNATEEEIAKALTGK